MNLSKTAGAVAAALLVLAGCTANASTSPTPGVVTLTLGTSEPEGRPTDLAMQDFATKVAELSNGSIMIDRKYELSPADHDWDHAFAQDFLDGEVDLAVVPARAWETVGVTSFAALQAPMLVDTDQLLDKVVVGEGAQTMLDGLGAVHATGLALLPVGLRHVYFFGEPPTSVAAMAGRGVRGPQSPTVWGFLSALGMTPDDPVGDAYVEGVRAGTLGAAETTYDIAPGAPEAATAVGNLVPYPYVLTLAARTDALAGLSDDQRRVLREAAEETRDGLLTNRQTDAEAAAAYCSSSHLAVVNLEPHQLAAALQAAAPVYAKLEQDPGTKDAIAAIRSIDDGLGDPSPDVVPCDGRTPTPEVEPNDPEAFPEGTYTADVTPAFLSAHGVDGTSAIDNAQTWTMTFRDGTYDDEQCPGSTYTVEDGVLTVTLGTGSVQGCGSAAGQVLFSSGWHLDGDQMTFVGAHSPVDTGPLIPALFGAHPFTKIG